MKSTKMITGSDRLRFLHKRDAERKMFLEERKRKNQRKTKLKKVVSIIIITLTFILLISLYYLLFNDESKNHAEGVSNLQLRSIENIDTNEPQLMENAELKVVETKVVKSADVSNYEVTNTTSETVTSINSQKEVEKNSVSIPTKKPIEKPVQKTSSIYNPNIPMPKEHQEYLYKRCQELGLNYKKTLASIKHESDFNVNVVSETNDYGYFQINKVNHQDLSQKLDTANSPLNPYVNIDWGTYMLSDLYNYWKDQGYTGTGLDNAVWSSYNKGLNGFKKYGQATAYINKMQEAIQFVNQSF